MKTPASFVDRVKQIRMKMGCSLKESIKKADELYNRDGSMKKNKVQSDSVVRSEASHTPTPWKLERNLIIGDNCTIVDLRGNMGGNDTDADAAFIVRAVNAHEELLQTLKHIEDLAEENTHSVQEGYYQIAEWARNQIAKAEGR